MKKIILLIAVIAFTVTAEKTAAQLRLNVNINIGTQPEWGPSGYDYAEYYYLPDIDVYYYVPQRQFIYLSDGRWVFGISLPARYRYYNLYNSYKVVINEPKPYLHYEVYRTKYAKYKGWYGKQSNNRYNDKYKSSKGHGKRHENKSNIRGHGKH